MRWRASSSRRDAQNFLRQEARPAARRAQLPVLLPSGRPAMQGVPAGGPDDEALGLALAAEGARARRVPGAVDGRALVRVRRRRRQAALVADGLHRLGGHGARHGGRGAAVDRRAVLCPGGGAAEGHGVDADEVAGARRARPRGVGGSARGGARRAGRRRPDARLAVVRGRVAREGPRAARARAAEPRRPRVGRAAAARQEPAGGAAPARAVGRERGVEAAPRRRGARRGGVRVDGAQRTRPDLLALQPARLRHRVQPGVSRVRRRRRARKGPPHRRGALPPRARRARRRRRARGERRDARRGARPPPPRRMPRRRREPRRRPRRRRRRRRRERLALRVRRVWAERGRGAQHAAERRRAAATATATAAAAARRWAR